MASLGHVLVGLALARAHQRASTPRARSAQVEAGTSLRRRALSFVAFPALAMLPDLDVIAFAFGIPYRDAFGHRGASHAMLTGLVVGALAGVLIARLTRTPIGVTVLLAALAMVSHGLLDTLTTGGEGAALFWPFTHERYFAPFRPIPVAPIGLGFLSMRGLYCAAVELALFSPFLVYALLSPRERPRTARG